MDVGNKKLGVKEKEEEEELVDFFFIKKIKRKISAKNKIGKMRATKS